MKFTGIIWSNNITKSKIKDKLQKVLNKQNEIKEKQKRRLREILDIFI